MLKRELKVYLKGWILWNLILSGAFIVVFILYPYLLDGGSMDSINEVLEIFPIEVLKAFNMDIIGLDSVFGWLKSEGYTFILLVTSCYSAILGSSIVLKEESDKTIEYLNSLPITRKQVFFDKVKVGIFYIVGMIAVIGLTNYIGLLWSGDFNQKQYFCLMLAPLFPAIVFFSITLLISTYQHKTKNMLGLSLGLVFVSYLISVLAQMSDKIDFLKYVSIFTLADVRHIIQDNTLSIACVIIALIICVVAIGYSMVHYTKKDLMS